jgi:hypothetical protein
MDSIVESGSLKLNDLQVPKSATHTFGLVTQMLSISIGGIHSALAGVGDSLAPRLTEVLPRKQEHADYRIDSHVHGGAIG